MSYMRHCSCPSVDLQQPIQILCQGPQELYLVTVIDGYVTCGSRVKRIFGVQTLSVSSAFIVIVGDGVRMKNEKM